MIEGYCCKVLASSAILVTEDCLQWAYLAVGAYETLLDGGDEQALLAQQCQNEAKEMVKMLEEKMEMEIDEHEAMNAVDDGDEEEDEMTRGRGRERS